MLLFLSYLGKTNWEGEGGGGGKIIPTPQPD